ncbi:MAG: DUF3108 domain-containing protein [Burkholderiales bacterium]
MRAALLLLALSHLSMGFAAPPNVVQIDFVVTSGPAHIGEGSDILEHDGQHYSIVSESRTAGIAKLFSNTSIRRQSRGQLLDSGMRPETFEEIRTRKPRRAAEFDWSAMQIRFIDGENSSTAVLPPASQDQTSFTYTFAFGTKLGDLIALPMTDGRRVTEYQFQKVGTEQLKTELGKLATLHYRKVLEGDEKRGLELWFSLAHHHLPVRIRYVEKNGTVVDSTATRIEYR